MSDEPHSATVASDHSSDECATPKARKHLRCKSDPLSDTVHRQSIQPAAVPPKFIRAKSNIVFDGHIPLGKSINAPVPSEIPTEQEFHLTDSSKYLAAEPRRSHSLTEWFFCGALRSLISPRPARSSFARITDQALRSCVAFIVAAVVSIQPWANTVFGVSYLFPIIAGLFVNNTVGETFQQVESQLKCTFVAAVVDTIILASTFGTIQNDTTRIIVAEVILFITSVAFMYCYINPVQRRMSLVLHCLVMDEVSRGVTRYEYPTQLFAGYVVAALLTVFIVALPFPRLAKDQLLDRWRVCVQILSRDMTMLTEAFLSKEPVRPRVLVATVREDLVYVMEQLVIMRKLQAETKWEGSIWHLWFPYSIYFGSIVRCDPGKLEQLFWIVSNLCDTISHINHTGIDHQTFVDRSWTAFDGFQVEQGAYVKLLTNDAGQDRSINQLIRRSHDRLIDSFHNLENLCMEARVAHYQVVGDRCDHAIMDPTMIASTSNEVFLHNLVSFYVGRWFHSLNSVGVDPFISEALCAASDSSSDLKKASAPLKQPLGTLQFHRSWAQHYTSPHSWSLVGLTPIADFKWFVKACYQFFRYPSIDVPVLKSSIKISLTICVAALFAFIPQINKAEVLPNSVWVPVTAAYLISNSEGMVWARGLQRLLGTCLSGLIGYLVLISVAGSWTGTIALTAIWIFVTTIASGYQRFQYMALLSGFSVIVIAFGKPLSPVTVPMTNADWALVRMMEISIGIIIYLLFSSFLWPVSSIRLLRSEMIVSLRSCENATKESVAMFKRILNREKQLEAFRSFPDLRFNGKMGRAVSNADFVEENMPDADCHNSPDVHSPDHHSPSQHHTNADHPHKLPMMEGIDEANQAEILRLFLSHANSVSSSLSRQEEYLEDAITEPIGILLPVHANQYRTLTLNIRRCWQLIISMEPALRDVVTHQIEQAKNQSIEPNDAIKRMIAFEENICNLTSQIHAIFETCVTMLSSGEPSDNPVDPAFVANELQKLRQGLVMALAKFSKSFRNAVPDCDSDHAQLIGCDAVPLSVFLHTTIELSAEALILELNVRCLLKQELPIYYDDRT